MKKEINYFYLFDDNPPVDEKYIQDLFCNRDKELNFCKKMLLSNSTFPGVLAAYGKTRSGKSHLIHRLLIDEDIKEKYKILKVNANSAGDVRSVFENIFIKLLDEMQTYPAKMAGDSKNKMIAIVKFLKKVEPLVIRHVNEVHLLESNEITQISSFNIKFPIYSIEGQLLSQNEVRTNEGSEVIIKEFDNRSIVDLVKYEFEILSRLEDKKKYILLIDDLDLIDQAFEPEKRQTDKLLNLLQVLSEIDSIIVLVTTRSSFFKGRDKNLSDFIQIERMNSDDILNVYKKRIETFHNGIELFTEDAKALLEKSSDGRIGIFLKNCKQIWREFHNMAEQKKLIDVNNIKQYLRQRIEQLSKDDDYTSLVENIKETIRKGKLEIKYDNFLENDQIIYDILDRVANTKDHYRVTKMYASVFRNIIEEEKA